MLSAILAPAARAGLLAGLLLATSPAAPAQSTWFPLEPGLRWTYQAEKGIGGKRTVTVMREEGEQFILDFNGTEVAIVPVAANGDVDIVLPGEGPGAFYRFDSEGWLHRDFRDCEDLRVLSVTSRDETVLTPAGEFSGCLRMEYEHGECVDAGTFAEWWAPDVGLVKWAEESFAGERTYVLVEFSGGETAPTFRRGDPDGSGTIDLSDAIGVLSWLFLGGPAPGCQDATDADDNGTIDLSDPIAVLGFLFLGAGAPPAPGPDVCGEDPTVDGLPACEAGCGGAGISGE